MIKKLKQDNGLTLVEIMIVVGILLLLAIFPLYNLITLKMTANETAAKGNIRNLMTAAETFAVQRGYYPSTVADLQEFIAAGANFCADASGTKTAIQGYNYACTMTTGGYIFEASPVTPGRTGNVVYTATTGGVLTPL